MLAHLGIWSENQPRSFVFDQGTHAMENDESIKSERSTVLTSNRVLKWYRKNQVQNDIYISLICVLVVAICNYIELYEINLIALKIALKSTFFAIILISFFLNYLKKAKPLLVVTLFSVIFAVINFITDAVIKSTSESFSIEAKLTAFLLLGVSLSVLVLIVQKSKVNFIEPLSNTK